MAFGANPGQLFIGALSSVDKAFIVPLLKAAKENGYTKMVEPCAGQLDMSVMASEIGFEDIEASDITMFSGVVGRYAEGRPIADMEICRLDTGELMEDPVEVLAQIKKRQLEDGAGSVYGNNLLVDFVRREADIRISLQEQLDELAGRINSIKYFDMDMFDHLEKVKDDEHAIVLCWCPTYKGGYEKHFQAASEVFSWREPWYTVFDPDNMYKTLYDFMADAKCLFLMVEETTQNECIGEPIYGRPSGRVGIYRYMVSNKPEEVERLVGKKCKPKAATKIKPSRYHLIPEDHIITDESEVGVVKLDAPTIRYYRELLTHNFAPSESVGEGCGVIVDGYLVGIFGYMAQISNGLPTRQCIAYAMAVPHEMRLLRLVYMVAIQRRSLCFMLSDIWAASCNRMLTKIITKYPSSVTMRGIMKLVNREPDDRCGYFLSYECDVQEREYSEVLAEFLKKERLWKLKKNDTK